MRRTMFMLILLCAAVVSPSVLSASPPAGETAAEPQARPKPPAPAKRDIPPPSPESKPPSLDAPPTDEQDQKMNALVRGAFLTTRPKGDAAGNSNAGARPTGAGSSKPAGTSKPAGPRAGTNKPPARTAPKTTPGPVAASSVTPETGAGLSPATSAALGVGYTLYLRDAQGRLIRTKPGREFVSGEGIRLSLEPNVDGYLYIFNTTDGRKLRMLYPHGLLNEGDNKVSAHATYQLPPAGYGQDFNFDAEPGVERLYIVVARKPLEGVETGAALVRLCQSRGAEAECEWEAPPVLMALLHKEAAERKLTSRNDESAGQPQTTAEQVSATRGLTLGKADPAPSVILLNASSAADIFVTTIDLVHK